MSRPSGAEREERVARGLKALEDAVGPLPDDYKRFMREGDFSRVPGEIGVSFEALEPTPFGGGVLEFFLEPDPARMRCFDHVEMLVIGANAFGHATCMSLRPGDRGSIYYHDHEQRALWDDARFRMMFEDLAPSIEAFLARRRAGTLPTRPEGLESFYRIAGSFSEFLERCEPMDAAE